MDTLAPAGGFIVAASVAWLAWHFFRGHHNGHHRGVGFGNALAGFIIGGATIFGTGAADAMATGAGYAGQAGSSITRHDQAAPAPAPPNTTAPVTPAPPAESRP